LSTIITLYLKRTEMQNLCNFLRLETVIWNNSTHFNLIGRFLRQIVSTYRRSSILLEKSKIS
jgi:hypothetical protein